MLNKDGANLGQSTLVVINDSRENYHILYSICEGSGQMTSLLKIILTGKCGNPLAFKSGSGEYFL